VSLARRPAAFEAWTTDALVAFLIIGCAPLQGAPPATPDHGGFLSIVLNTQDPAADAVGFTTVDATPEQLLRLAPGRMALVWLGSYDNGTCTWEQGDDEISRQIRDGRLATDGRVAGYYLADEPNSEGNCPGAAAQLRQRSDLVRALDPDKRHFTFANIDDPGLFAAFRESVDVIGTDPYPCARAADCDWALIPSYVEALRRAGVTHYMGMLQVFSAGPWRWPTAAELRRMIMQWRMSDWCGALTFSWSYLGGSLPERTDLVRVLHDFNAHRPNKPSCVEQPNTVSRG
jgi:hypothetical protein